MEDLKKLEELSLVSKVCTELENHLGPQMNDKVLAEFCIAMADEHPTLESFKGVQGDIGDVLTVSSLCACVYIITAPSQARRAEITYTMWPKPYWPHPLSAWRMAS